MDLKSGVRRFRDIVFPEKQGLFEKLSHGQNPETLFIACSDSRVDPALITQTQPGDLFVIRNVGNIVPPCGAILGAEAAAIDFAVSVVGVKNIVVCGHIGCAAVRACVCPEEEVPQSMVDWLKHSQSTHDTMHLKHRHLKQTDKTEFLRIAVQEHVQLQIDHLRTYASVNEALAAGKLRIYGWTYDIQNGEIVNHKFHLSPAHKAATRETTRSSSAPEATATRTTAGKTPTETRRS